MYSECQNEPPYFCDRLILPQEFRVNRLLDVVTSITMRSTVKNPAIIDQNKYDCQVDGDGITQHYGPVGTIPAPTLRVYCKRLKTDLENHDSWSKPSSFSNSLLTNKESLLFGRVGGDWDWCGLAFRWVLVAPCLLLFAGGEGFRKVSDKWDNGPAKKGRSKRFKGHHNSGMPHRAKDIAVCNERFRCY